MTHNERVLDLLSDGKPHSHHEGYRLNVMLHSRVADLRKKGHVIECWREGDNYLYRLLPAGAAGLAASPAPAGSEIGNPPESEPCAGALTSPSSDFAPPFQLSLEDAA